MPVTIRRTEAGRDGTGCRLMGSDDALFSTRNDPALDEGIHATASTRQDGCIEIRLV